MIQHDTYANLCVSTRKGACAVLNFWNMQYSNWPACVSFCKYQAAIGTLRQNICTML